MSRKAKEKQRIGIQPSLNTFSFSRHINRGIRSLHRVFFGGLHRKYQIRLGQRDSKLLTVSSFDSHGYMEASTYISLVIVADMYHN